jgi:hypothetical protein
MPVDPDRFPLTARLGEALRYEVMVRDLQQREVVYVVATRVSEAKAVALATQFYIEHYPDADEGIFDVSVRPVGVVSAKMDGSGHVLSYDLHCDDLVDPCEWA